MTVEVIDPLGFEHVLIHKGQWWGTENLAHPFDGPLRKGITAELMARIEASPDGEWRGYRWSRR